MGKRGGGVAMPINNDLSNEPLEIFCLTTGNLEAPTVLSKTIVFSILYRSPNAGVRELLEILGTLFSFASDNSWKLFLSVDLNIDMLASRNSQNFWYLVLSFNRTVCPMI